MFRTKSVPYRPQAKYPGMRPKDVAIWDQFIIDYPHAFKRVAYDVHLGDPVQIEENRADMLKSGMYEVCQWCIDVLGDDGTRIWAIEIKPNAGGGALGQALAYAALVSHDSGLKMKALPLVITDEISPITQHVANMLRVKILSPIRKDK